MRVAGAINGVDYQATGQSLARLGWADLSVAQIKSLLEDGFAPNSKN
jgi:hypothetical protein